MTEPSHIGELTKEQARAAKLRAAKKRRTFISRLGLCLGCLSPGNGYLYCASCRNWRNFRQRQARLELAKRGLNAHGQPRKRAYAPRATNVGGNAPRQHQ